MKNNNLKEFYNEQAEKFSGTRKKNRPEFQLILNEILKYTKKNNQYYKNKTLNILELGCGDGRFFRFLKNKLNKKFNYTGVDFSKGLLNIAKKESPTGTRINKDMIKFLYEQEQEQYDIIISIASIQHIENKKNRNLLIRFINRSLRYGGKHISINRAMSDSFKRKFKKEITKSFIKYIITLGNRDKNNIFIPFKTKEKIYQRLYHIFTIEEIKNITSKNGLVLSDYFFVGKNGNKTNKSNARNIFFIQTKDIFK